MHPEAHQAGHGHGGDQPHHTTPEAVARDHPYIGVGIVTISDTASRGERDDLSGKAIKDNLHRFGGTLRHYEIVPDEQDIITQTLIHVVDDLHLDLVLTTGGTGLSPRDRTPQATLPVLDYEVPGLAEAMRAESAKKAPMAYLSRAVAGVRQESLIINLPGSPKACVETLEILAPLLPHAIQILRGDVSEHKPSDRS
ncbi:MAG TPA: MogA/MoaB family molybdenum cofactor biosynthesis protein [Chloroflexota bacterium]|nr:MogA/MoaB family molybdenum cofactor biosynthesis protein [Chloroflexota bacterium]